MDRQLAEDMASLGNEGDPAAYPLIRRQNIDPLAEEADLPPVHLQDPGDGPHDGRLAGAVGADDGDDLFLPHPEAGIVDGGYAIVTNLNVLYGEHDVPPLSRPE